MIQISHALVSFKAPHNCWLKIVSISSINLSTFSETLCPMRPKCVSFVHRVCLLLCCALLKKNYGQWTWFSFQTWKYIFHPSQHRILSRRINWAFHMMATPPTELRVFMFSGYQNQPQVHIHLYYLQYFNQDDR